MSQKTCYHCGDDVIGKGIELDDKEFCCNGCKSVYQLLSSNQLDSFYAYEAQSGVRPQTSDDHKFSFLDVAEIRSKFIDFEDKNSTHTTLFLPEIHCSSCIYLLENLHKIENRVISCQVNFAKREASIVFSKEMKLSELADILTKIGYTPNFGNREDQKKKQSKTYLYKLGVAGFAFGSIMLWTFPEYFGIEKTNPEIRQFSAYLAFIVSIPVILYSANEYFVSAYKAIRYKSINLDVPISLGILALYFQSVYKIFSEGGTGYIDSFAGFVFFLLIGKWFQSKTYQSLSFERDYTAYFPVAVTKKTEKNELIVEIDKIDIGDTIIIRNQEVIPCDSKLLSESIKIDYSFVTGESIPVTKHKGDFIYAGGKLIGKKSEFLVEKESNRSHLTQLWNEVNKDEESDNSKEDKLSAYFLYGILVISVLAGVIWFNIDSTRTTEIVVSVLIVACPCALALSKPFTYGNIMRSLGRKGMYLKSNEVIERINETTDIVFDKTGTLTTGSSNHVQFITNNSVKDKLTEAEINSIILLANSSTHPLSKSIVRYLKPKSSISNYELIQFEEIEGKGIKGIINGIEIRIGSSSFTKSNTSRDDNQTISYITFDEKEIGYFIFESEFRPGIIDLLNNLSKSFTVHVLSGDKDRDKAQLQRETQNISELHFKQTPKDKLEYIERIQEKGRKVMMVGDGLNDAGALESSNVGIAISEDIFRFSPKSDAILEASKIGLMNRFIKTSLFSRKVLMVCYSFSIIYNIVGLGFAVTGFLTPLIAAILMPLSSISIVLISTILAQKQHR